MDDEQTALVRMKAEFLQMTATLGWQRAEKFAETIIRDLERASVNEMDDVKATALRHDARGASKFWDEFKGRITRAINQVIEEPGEDPADQFYAILEKKPETTQ